MKKIAQPNAQQPQKSASESSVRSLRQSGADGRTPSHLSELASAIHQSPRVQAQLKRVQELQDGPKSQKHAGLAAEINEGVSAAVQRKGREEKKPALTKSKDEKKPAMKKAVQAKAPEEKRPAQKATAQLEEAPAVNRTGLPDQLKAGVENLSGLSLDDVKVHYNSAKPAHLNALAYAQGTDIHVAPGQERHLPHEAWHIVQQKQGRVQPTTQMKAGVPVNDDPKLEHEADVMGRQAAQRLAEAADRDDTSLQEVDDHGTDCACPGCCQMKSVSARQLAAISPAYAIENGLVQTKPCPECNKEKGHLSGCSRHKNRRGAKAKEKKQVHVESSSWENMQCYRPGWVKKNGITEELVKEFCRDYDRGRIRGHCSRDQTKEEQQNTKDDLDAYKSWHTTKFGKWK